MSLAARGLNRTRTPDRGDWGTPGPNSSCRRKASFTGSAGCVFLSVPEGFRGSFRVTGRALPSPRLALGLGLGSRGGRRFRKGTAP